MPLGPKLKCWLYATAALLWATGAAWLIVHYLPVAPPYPTGSAANLMLIHGAAAMAFLVLTGMVTALHVPGAWRERQNRLSGLAMGTFVISLLVTGYALYYAGGESLRAFASAGHWMPGVALPIVVIWHALAARRARRASFAG